MTDRLDGIRKRNRDFGMNGERASNMSRRANQMYEDIAYLLAEVEQLQNALKASIKREMPVRPAWVNDEGQAT